MKITGMIVKMTGVGTMMLKKGDIDANSNQLMKMMIAEMKTNVFRSIEFCN